MVWARGRHRGRSFASSSRSTRQYWSAERQRGVVVYAFRGTIERENTHAFVLRGLQPSAHYVVKFSDHSSTDRKVTGRELMGKGLKVTLPLQNSSELIFIDGEPNP